MTLPKAYLDSLTDTVLAKGAENIDKERARQVILKKMECSTPEELLVKVQQETRKKMAKKADKPITTKDLKKALPKSTAYCSCGKPILKPDVLRQLMAAEDIASKRLVPMLTDQACKCEGDDIQAFERRWADFEATKAKD